MKVIIIEDEISNVKRLKKMIENIDPDMEVAASLESVEESIAWLKNNEEPDLIFMDIQLSDGLSFEIFDEINLSTPIIFTTAYDEYTLQAFKVNSIDYLLKPIDPKELEKSIEKFYKLNENKDKFNQNNISELLKSLNIKQSAYKSRFLVKFANSFYVVNAEDIEVFYIENQLVYLITKQKRKFSIDFTLDEVDKSLDPKIFFRINRQMIVNWSSIISFEPYFNSRLKLKIGAQVGGDIIVSREKVSTFKDWLDK